MKRGFPPRYALYCLLREHAPAYRSPSALCGNFFTPCEGNPQGLFSGFFAFPCQFRRIRTVNNFTDSA